MSHFLIYYLVLLTITTHSKLHHNLTEEVNQYTGYKLIRADTLTDFNQNLTDDLLKMEVDIWSPNLMLVSPEALDDVIQLLQNHHVGFNFTDVQKLLEEKGQSKKLQTTEKVKTRNRRQHSREHEYCREMTVSSIIKTLNTRGSYNYSKHRPLKNSVLDAPKYVYLDFCQIKTWLAYVSEKYSDVMSLIVYGYSYENRPLVAVKLRIGDVRNITKPVVFIDAGIHAREWISVSSAIFLIHKFVTEYQLNGTVKRLLEDYDWYIIPVLNPDGYEYSHYRDRLWRKTRCRTIKPHCYGVDANRNFNFFWGFYDSFDPISKTIMSKYYRDQCSELYAGKRGFSEPETHNFSRFFWQKRRSIKAYFSFHSFGNYWLLPFGYSNFLPGDYSDMYNVSIQAVERIYKEHGVNFTVGTPGKLLYFASGGSFDWVKGRVGIKYVFALELSNDENKGFLSPPKEIIPVGGQTFTGVSAAIEAMSEQDPCWVFSRDCTKNIVGTKPLVSQPREGRLRRAKH